MTEESTVILIYGPSGVGKTTDCGYSFPNAYFLAAPGALKSIENTCGYTPKRGYLRTIPEVIKALDILAEKKTYKTVVIDDFSFMAEQTFNDLEQKEKLSGYDLFGRMRDIGLNLRDKSRFCGIDVVLNAWESPPRLVGKAKSFVRGGPQLSGKLPEHVPAMCDVVYRAISDSAGNNPWPMAYECEPNGEYVSKDRNDVAVRINPAPMNLGELLRASGLKIPRIHEDQEEQVEKISLKFDGNMDHDKEVVSSARQALKEKGHDRPRIRWTLRDAYDRFLIRKRLDEADETFFRPVKKDDVL